MGEEIRTWKMRAGTIKDAQNWAGDRTWGWCEKDAEDREISLLEILTGQRTWDGRDRLWASTGLRSGDDVDYNNNYYYGWMLDTLLIWIYSPLLLIGEQKHLKRKQRINLINKNLIRILYMHLYNIFCVYLI